MNPELPLKDIHLPDPIGWWPLAPGWWLVAIGITLILALLYWLYRKLTRETTVKAARQAFLKLKRDTKMDELHKIAALSVLFRRTAVSLFPRSDTASLTGEGWLKFLQRPLQDSRFTNGVGRLLNEAPYRREAPDTETLQALFKLYEDWLKAAAKMRKL